jgi:DNA-binding XRE family transcriptional regulator
MDTPKTEQVHKKDDKEKPRDQTAKADADKPDAKKAGARTESKSGESSVKQKATRKNNVRKLRMERMMSKAELARRAGLSTLTIDRVEKGMPCRMDTKRKILEALGLTPSDRVKVFGEDD